MLDVARVGVGALGIVSTVTVAVRARLQPARGRGADARRRGARRLGRLTSSDDHFEFFWVPNTGWALTKRNHRTDEPAAPRGRWQALRDDLLSTTWRSARMCRVGRRRPELIPTAGQALPSTGRLDYIDRSDKVFASPRFVRFYEMEYAIPREAVPEALTGCGALVDEAGL